MARIARFYKHESCGQCTPCREGSGRMWRMLERMAKNEASKDEIDMLADVTKQIEGHTICAFGEGSSWPVQGLLRHFKDEIKRNKFDPIIKENKNIPYLVDQHLLDKMLKLKANDIDVEVEEGLTVLQACEKAGVEYQDFVITKNYL